MFTEKGVNLTLTVVDTPGFGDAVDNSNCWDPVISFVEDQYEQFLDAETRVNRVQMPDSRVHACLYFIAPSGHGLKPLDVEFMKRLHDKVSHFHAIFTTFLGVFFAFFGLFCPFLGTFWVFLSLF